MRGKLLTFSFLLIVAVCFSSGANAADMVPEYLHGNWAIGTTEQKCGDSDAEYKFNIATFRNACLINERNT